MDLMQRIKQDIRIEDYLAGRGYHVLPHGHGHLRLKEHDSLVIDPAKNRFWWNSAGTKGSIIDLVMALDGVSQEDAIRSLAKQLYGQRPPQRAAPAPAPKPREPVPLVLPTRDNQNWRRIYGYLINTRGIAPEVVKWLAEQKIIYPDERGNLVYIAYGQDGKANYAAKKGTATGNHYRSVVEGSNCELRAGWNLNATAGWFVTEAAVDAWSIMSLLANNGQDWRQYGYVSLESCHVRPLQAQLACHAHPQKIWLGQDADEAGIKSRALARELLQSCGYTGKVVDKVPPIGKDWNDTLLEQGDVSLMVEEQAVRVEVQAAKLTAGMLAKLLKSAAEFLKHQQTKTVTGQQSLKLLNRQGKATSHVEVSKETLADVKRQMNSYYVDFSITKDKNTGKLTLWFKGQDVDRIQKALENCIVDLGKAQPQQSKVQEVCNHAKEQAAVENATRTAQPPERSERL